MRKTFLISIVSSFLTLCMGVSAQGVLLNVTTLDRYPYGIDGGNIVGRYFSSSFIYDGSTYTTLDVPGASSTYAGDIDGGNIVGQYSGAGGNHGFIYDGTTYTTLDIDLSLVPEAYSTHAYGIDGNNIVGIYYDGNQHGFIYDGLTYTILNVPGGTKTYAHGIDGSNIVGEYEDGSGRHGFRAVVPEPATLSLLAIGMLMASHRRRLRRV